MTDKQKSQDYSRGYQAGRKRLEKDDASYKRTLEEMRKMHEQQVYYNTEKKRFEREVFVHALNGILHNGTWTYDGKKATGVPEHIAIAETFAKQAVKKMMP